MRTIFNAGGSLSENIKSKISRLFCGHNCELLINVISDMIRVCGVGIRHVDKVYFSDIDLFIIDNLDQSIDLLLVNKQTGDELYYNIWRDE